MNLEQLRNTADAQVAMYEKTLEYRGLIRALGAYDSLLSATGELQRREKTSGLNASEKAMLAQNAADIRTIDTTWRRKLRPIEDQDGGKIDPLLEVRRAQDCYARRVGVELTRPQPSITSQMDAAVEAALYRVIEAKRDFIVGCDAMFGHQQRRWPHDLHTVRKLIDGEYDTLVTVHFDVEPDDGLDPPDDLTASLVG